MTTKNKKEIELPVKFTKLILRDAKVIFANLVDEGFGTSITIDATDPEVKQKITDWVAENKIGKTKPGVANFKEYTPEDSDEVTLQFSSKIKVGADEKFPTKFKGIGGLTKENLGFGAIVDLALNAFPFDNKFGKGVSHGITAVLIKSGVASSGDEDMDELTAGIEEF